MAGAAEFFKGYQIQQIAQYQYEELANESLRSHSLTPDDNRSCLGAIDRDLDFGAQAYGIKRVLTVGLCIVGGIGGEI